jgi:flagellar biosynthesis protein FlhG
MMSALPVKSGSSSVRPRPRPRACVTHQTAVQPKAAPTSIADAYGTVKILAMLQKRQDFRIVINQVKNATEGGRIASQLQTVANRFLTTQLGMELKLQHMGDIPIDPAVPDAVRKRKLLLEVLPGAPAARAVTALAAALEAAS